MDYIFPKSALSYCTRNLEKKRRIQKRGKTKDADTILIAGLLQKINEKRSMEGVKHFL